MLRLIQKHITYDFERCQQCGVCEPVCPVGAITLRDDEQDGLKRVVVDDSVCVRCSKCVKACPANRLEHTDEDTLLSTSYTDSLIDKRYFLAWNKDENIRRKSSSGGATKTIIINALRSGAVDGVYTLRSLDRYPSAIGEYYDRENIPDYDTLPNSVYHSIPACREIANVPRTGKLMIVGTSCQLYALEKALKGRYNELVKVCIFCKQQKSLDSTRYLAKMVGTELTDVNRLKVQYRGDGWPGKVKVGEKELAWSRAATLPFGRRLWCVPGCDVCADPFGMECGADITMMDPWDIERENKAGATLVVAHSRRGTELLDNKDLKYKELTFHAAVKALKLEDIWRKRVCSAYYYGKEVPFEVAEAAEADLQQRRQLEKLLTDMPSMPTLFYRMLNKVTPRKRDKMLPAPELAGEKRIVKVITRHAPSNYGSLLQSIATLKVLEQLGFDAEIIDYQRPDERGWKKVWTEARRKSGNPLKQLLYAGLRIPLEGMAQRRFDKMRQEYLKLTPRYKSMEEMEYLSADIFLTGSDQVWGPTVGGDLDKAYLLEFASEGRKVAYAASFGKTAFTPEAAEIFKESIGKYYAVAVREDSAVKLLDKWGLENCMGRVLDPTLMLSAEEWAKLLDIPEKRAIEEPYILIYQIHNDPKLSAYAKELASITGKKLVRVNPFMHQALRGGKFICCPDASKFLQLIRDADLLVTDSFHGTCFAVTFNTQFVEILPNNNTGTRNIGLLSMLFMEHRIVGDFKDYSVINNKTIYESVNILVKAERLRSKEILKSILGPSRSTTD